MERLRRPPKTKKPARSAGFFVFDLSERMAVVIGWYRFNRAGELFHVEHSSNQYEQHCISTAQTPLCMSDRTQGSDDQMTDNTPAYEWASWSEPGELHNEPLSPDRLGRAAYAEFLTHYLNHVGQRDGGYVINLNAEWGAGKTWFLKRWCATLKPHHPVAYIDAWKNDFSDDPLLTVVSGVLEALKQNPHVRWIEREQKLFSKLGQFAKRGVDVTDVVLKANGINGLGEAFGVLLSSHQKKSEGIDALRSEIRNWLRDVTESPHSHNIQNPMYVFIDELDRCRPTYAIELLETVKHLFEIEGIVFVIATNTDQLQHSIRAVYGEGFDANRYLYRFFNRSAALPIPDSLTAFISTSDIGQRLIDRLAVTGDGDVVIAPDNLIEVLGSLADGFGFDLRTCNQWLEQLFAVYSNDEACRKFFWLVTAIMLGLRLGNPEIYAKYVKSLWYAEDGSIPSNQPAHHPILRGKTKACLQLNLKSEHLKRKPYNLPERATGYVPPGLPLEVKITDKVCDEWIWNIVDVFQSNRGNETHLVTFWDDGDKGYSHGYFIAGNYFVVKHKATREGYVALVEQAGLLL
ncbi:KAP family P-loop NTPase fold protein [Parathalassolituus penaei]|uniref:P-loop NTPase fold protein n=1 Tax=Parathalassolituus penaei TaxID=2997323 RepID=A0A9X3EM99_9GAMM|nr:P-loop NTPase fold protein [Parathalassolituus penaei]MCY0965263.1 P-loop NTPase fold protein [Parathalassolituus penaei]